MQRYSDLLYYSPSKFLAAKFAAPLGALNAVARAPMDLAPRCAPRCAPRDLRVVVTAVIVCVALLRSAVDWSQTSLGCGPAHEHASCSWSTSTPLGFCERGSCRESPSGDVDRSDRYDSTQVRGINRRLDRRGQRALFTEATEKFSEATQVDRSVSQSVPHS